MKDFYKKFQIVSHLPGWSFYLKKVYQLAQVDSQKFGIKPLLDRSNITCFLCGVSGEITADEYIKFVLEINKNAHIIIIDLGENQINNVLKLVKSKYSNKNIEVKRVNALNLSFIKSESVDWIDTDGFFNDKNLLILLKEWKRILKKDGFITFRELVSHNLISKIAETLRILITKIYMGITLNRHDKKQLENTLTSLGFKFTNNLSPIPALYRYCMVTIFNKVSMRIL